MDRVELREKALDALKKYRYVLPVLLVGVILMLLPEGKVEEMPPATPIVESKTMDLQTALENILRNVEGAGKVQVLLTPAAGERVVYQTDENINTGESTKDIRRETVIITDSGRSESGLVQQVLPPVYQGAIVLCQGADSPTVRLFIVEAVAKATGLSTNHITVLKMKG